jgi:class 3 adenylate cyclase/tetratricopeptide (TPR) repeat protein
MDSPSLAPLLPIAMRQVLAGEPNPFEAVVLFADLAGYSRFCAELIEHDARGAEAVGRMLNRLTQQFAETINRHGGSVLAFAGDATMALWPLSEAACRQALACADALHGIAAATMTKPLPLRIFVDVGPLLVFDLDLGGGGRRVLAQGKPLDRIGIFAAKVATGHTGASTEFLAALDDPAVRPVDGESVHPLAGPFPLSRADAPVVPACDATPYIASHVVRLLTGSTRDWLAEFRRATIFFATLPPLPEERLASVLEELATPITAANGVVLQILTDDKGLVLHAVWGLATNTHADDASRAVMAAIAMRSVLREAGGGAGIASGKVWCGLLGGSAEQQFAVIGDPVNLASALSRAAPGELRIDAATAQAVAVRFALSPAAPIRTKSDRTSRPVFCDPVEKIAAISGAMALVGRAGELARALDLLSKTGAIVSLIGEAGIGKSRVTMRLREELEAREQPFRTTTADSLRRSSPFHAWPTVFAGLVTEMSLAALNDVPALAGRLPLLNPVLPQMLPETDVLRQLDPGTRGALAREAIAEAAARLWPDPAGVLVIEDAHWLDSASWLVLADLRRKRPDLTLLLVTRGSDPESLPREAVAMLNLPEACDIELGPLSLEEAGALAADALGVRDLPPALVRRIHDRAEGHPLFTAELARSLRDRGLVQTVAGRATVRLDESGIEAINFPDGIEAVIAERISMLDPPVQLTVKAASVLGRHFSAQALASIRPESSGSAATEAHIGAMTASGLIEPDVGSGYRFHHALIQETAHSLLLREQRIALHTAAARLLEGESNMKSATVPLIAQHWSLAEEHDRAMDAFERAADHARTIGAHAEVVEFVSLALDHGARAKSAPEPSRTGRWHYLSGNSLREMGYYRRGVDALRTSISLLDKPMPVSAAAAVFRSISELARLKLPRRQVARGSREEALLVAGAMHALSEISYEHDDIPQTLASLLAGLNKAERAGGDSVELTKLLMGSAFVGLSAPWAIDALAYRDRSLAMAARLDDPALWSWVLFIAGNFEFGIGDFVSAREYLNRAIPICEETGEIKNWYSAVASLGNVLRVEGRLHDSQAQDQILLARSLDRGMVLAEVWAWTALAKSNAMLNKFDELDICIARMEAIFADPANVREGSTDNYMTLHLARSAAASAAGHDTEALDALNETVRLLATLKNPAIYGMEPITMVTDMLARLARRGVAPRMLVSAQKKIIAYAKRLAAQYPTARGKLMLARGDLYALEGRQDRARREWIRAQMQAEAMRTPYDEAGAWQRLGDPRAMEILARLGVPRPLLWE